MAAPRSFFLDFLGDPDTSDLGFACVLGDPDMCDPISWSQQQTVYLRIGRHPLSRPSPWLVSWRVEAGRRGDWRLIRPNQTPQTSLRRIATETSARTFYVRCRCLFFDASETWRVLGGRVFGWNVEKVMMYNKYLFLYWGSSTCRTTFIQLSQVWDCWVQSSYFVNLQMQAQRPALFRITSSQHKLSLLWSLLHNTETPKIIWVGFDQKETYHVRKRKLYTRKTTCPVMM